jgi:hypothetical protein
VLLPHRQNRPKPRLIGAHPLQPFPGLSERKFFDHRPYAGEGAEFEGVLGVDGASGRPAADRPGLRDELDGVGFDGVRARAYYDQFAFIYFLFP